MLADAIVIIHALFVAFVVFGMAAIVVGLVLRWGWVRNFWFRVLHLAAIGLWWPRRRWPGSPAR